ncbi:LD-carboxypeptidase [Enterobacteriaceae bacterium 89]|nr:LD-carboxypeptidase [Enterobacteriaceae bacterium 89]
MNIRFPPRLAAGDVIAITAPSSGVPPHLHPRLNLAIHNLRQRGYQVREGQCLRSQFKNKSADKFERAAELMAFLTDPEIKAVMPPWGGDLGMELLDLLDFDLLRETKPKWFVGFSDLTTFQFPLATLAGWATAHGPNLMDLGAYELDETTKAVWRILESESGSAVEQQASNAYQTEENQWGKSVGAGFSLTAKTQWKSLNPDLTETRFEGRLIGGCLDILTRIAGTHFGALPEFVRQNAGDGIILYFENVEMGPCELTRGLLSLRLQGWFSSLQGILIGRSAGPDSTDVSQMNYVEALNTALGDLRIAVIYDVDIGHIPPQMTLVNGALAKVEFSGHGGSITQRV